MQKETVAAVKALLSPEMSMSSAKWVILNRECEALLIPTAVPMTIPPGTELQIIQTLGGHITANVHGNLLRIARSDADALGLDPSELEEVKPVAHEGPIALIEEDSVWDQLKTVFDPEIPVNIVDLGLVYTVKLKPIYDGEENLIGNKILIEMTLTAPGCGMGPVIVEDAKAKVFQVPSVTDVEIELVFEPPWDKEMMSESAKLELGLF
jgi:probable FeS assembly SUF system protein SufT